MDNQVYGEYIPLIIAEDFDAIKSKIENQEPALSIIPVDKDVLASSFYNIGNMANNYKKYNLSIKLYKEALKYSQRPSIYNNLGTNYKKIGDYTQAEKYYLEALSVNPEYLDGYLRLATLKAYIGEDDDALENYHLYLNKGGSQENAADIIKSTSLGGDDLNKLIKSREEGETQSLLPAHRVERWKKLYEQFNNYAYQSVTSEGMSNYNIWEVSTYEFIKEYNKLGLPFKMLSVQMEAGIGNKSETLKFIKELDELEMFDGIPEYKLKVRELINYLASPNLD